MHGGLPAHTRRVIRVKTPARFDPNLRPSNIEGRTRNNRRVRDADLDAMAASYSLCQALTNGTIAILGAYGLYRQLVLKESSPWLGPLLLVLACALIVDYAVGKPMRARLKD